MARKQQIRVWYDKQADFLEVLFERKRGHFRETGNDSVMEKVDGNGRVIGFSIVNVSSLGIRKPLSVTLKSQVA